MPSLSTITGMPSMTLHEVLTEMAEWRLSEDGKEERDDGLEKWAGD